MIRAPLAAGLHLQAPSAPLARYIRTYWLGVDNRAPSHDIVPDGCVDVVLHVQGGNARLWAYGTTTRVRSVPIGPGHYLGIRFRPGMTHPFLRVAAAELTDRREALDREFIFDGDQLAESIDDASIFSRVDGLLRTALAAVAPAPSRLEAAVRDIDAGGTSIRIDALAAGYGRGRRQFERDFLREVGIPAKQFAVISRFRQAAQRLARRERVALADVAADAGYADQSHMVRDFQRLAGSAPSRWQPDVVFIQDR